VLSEIREAIHLACEASDLFAGRVASTHHGGTGRGEVKISVRGQTLARIPQKPREEKGVFLLLEERRGSCPEKNA